MLSNLSKYIDLYKPKIKFYFFPLVFLIIVILFFAFGIYSFYAITCESLDLHEDFKGSIPIRNIEFSFDQKNWSHYERFSSVNTYDKKNKIFIRGTFPKNEISDPLLFLHTKSNFATLYYDNMKLESNLETYSNRAAGDIFNVFQLESGYGGKDFLIIMRTSNKRNIGLINKFEIRQKFYVYTNYLFEGLSLTIFSIFSILIGFIVSLTFISQNYRLDGYHYIGFFSIFIGLIWYANINIFSSAFFENNFSSSIFSYIILYLLPLPVIKYIKNFDNSNASFYNNIFFYYLIVIILILCCEILGIINIEYWFPYISLFFLIIILLALYIYSFKIFNKQSSDKLTYLEKYALPLFIIEIFAVTYDTFIIFNTLNITSRTQLTPITHTVFLIITIYTFSKDLKLFNEAFSINSEKLKLNKISINKLVEYQGKIFADFTYEYIKDNYFDTISDFLFPTKTENNIPIKDIISSATYNDFYKNYNDFLTYSSSYIYMTKPESIFSTKDEKAIIISASGIYKPYVNKDPFETLNSTLLKKINSNLSADNTVSNDNIILRIGNADTQHGVMVFENIGYLSENQIALLESYMSTIAILLENDLLLSVAKKTQANTVYNLNEFSELRSKETGNHIRRVALYSRLIGSKCGLNDDELETLQLASSMHDIGKINIPDAILNKPGKLTNEEFAIMQTHSYEGYKILQNIKNPVIEAGSVVAYYHHERFDGTGLFGLKGDEIPIFVRIVSIADVFDALFSKRVYKEAWHLQSILELFNEQRNKQFDSNLVDILFENIDEMLEIKSAFTDEMF